MIKNLISWEHFGPCLRNKRFSQIKGLCWNTANNINFHYRINSVEINDQIFQYIKKKTVFGPFSQFWGQKGHACTISYGFLVVYRKSPHGEFPPGQFPLGEFPPGEFPPSKFPPSEFPPNEFVGKWMCYHCALCTHINMWLNSNKLV